MGECQVTIEGLEEDEEKGLMIKNKRKTSEMWNYFTPISSNHALCNLCSQRFSYRTSTSNLRKHIVCKHSSAHLSDTSPKFTHPVQQKDIRESPDRVTIKRDSPRQITNEPMNRHSFSEFTNSAGRSNSRFSDQRRETDEYDAYAFTVAAKLRKMNEKQRLYCERIVNDALFKGALEQLTPLSEIVICIPTSSSQNDS